MKHYRKRKEKQRPKKEMTVLSPNLVFKGRTRVAMHIFRLLCGLWFHTSMVLGCLWLSGYQWATNFVHNVASWSHLTVPNTYMHIYTHMQIHNRIWFMKTLHLQRKYLFCWTNNSIILRTYNVKTVHWLYQKVTHWF